MASPAVSPCVLTSGDLAEILKVNRWTVCKWIDSKKLRGYRLPGGYRRVLLEHAIEWAQRNGHPTEALEQWGERHGAPMSKCPSVLLLSPCTDQWQPFFRAIFMATAAENPLHAGLILARHGFVAAVLDTSLGSQHVHDVLEFVRLRASSMYTVVLAGEDDPNPDYWTVQGANMAYKKPVDMAQVAHQLWCRLSARKPAVAPAATFARTRTQKMVA